MMLMFLLYVKQLWQSWMMNESIVNKFIVVRGYKVLKD
jgi:hypothetical protein